MMFVFSFSRLTLNFNIILNLQNLVLMMENCQVGELALYFTFFNLKYYDLPLNSVELKRLFV